MSTTLNGNPVQQSTRFDGPHKSAQSASAPHGNSPKYSTAFLASLFKHPDSYSPEDLAEMWVQWQKDHPTYSLNAKIEAPRTHEQGFVLSKEIRKRGHALSECQALILDVAQIIHKRFKNGMAVSFRTIKRIIMQYHAGDFSRSDLKHAAQDLRKRDILKVGQGIRLIEHFGSAQADEGPSGFSKLASDAMQIEVLRACNDCCGVGFRNQNVSPRAAVRSLMMARFPMSGSQFEALAEALTEGDILQEVASKGTTAFRLTQSSIGILDGDELAEPKGVGKSPTPEQEGGVHATLPSAEPTKTELPIAERVQQAFRDVAYGWSTTLSRLLVQTRLMELSDSAVQKYLIDEERLARVEGIDTEHFHCCRAKNGDIYIESSSGVSSDVASIREAFTELPTTATDADSTDEEPPQTRDDILRHFGDAEARRALFHTGKHCSPLACSLVYVAMGYCEGRQIRVAMLAGLFSDTGFTFTEFQRAVGELDAMEAIYLMTSEVEEMPDYWVEFLNIDTGAEQTGFLQVFDSVRKHFE